MDHRVVQGSLTRNAGLTDVYLGLLGLNGSADIYGGVAAASKDHDLTTVSHGVEHGLKLRTTGDDYPAQGLESDATPGRVNGRIHHQIVARQGLESAMVLLCTVHRHR